MAKITYMFGADLMQARKFLHLIFIIVTLVVMLQGCKREPETLYIAAHKWPGYEFMFLADREGYLKNKAIKLVETQSATESLDALAKGKVVGAALTLDEVLRARAAGIPLQVVLVVDESAGADALVAKQNFKSLSELKGKRIGVERTAVGALMLHKILEEAKLKESDVVLVDSSIDQHIADWNANKFDAVITYQPILSELIKLEGHRIIDSRKLEDLIFDVLAIRSDLDSNYDEQVENLIKGHFKALNNLRKSPQDTAYRMAAHLDLDGSQVLETFRGLEIPSLLVNRRYLDYENRIGSAAKELSKQMLKLNLLNKPDSLKTLITQKYLPLHGHD